jgi:hypothetical protein
MSYKTCPDWPELMEIAPELQFKHMSAADAQLPVDVLTQVSHQSLGDVELCCDLDRHVFYDGHTDAELANALRASHWYELKDWASSGQGSPPPAA